MDLNWCVLVCAIVLSVVCADDVGEDTWLVHIEQGPVLGHRDPNVGVFNFYDIPYATAPTGSEKFKPPLPPPTWREPLDAVNRGIICPQVTVPVDLGNTTQQEDCLVASVFAPGTDKKNLPVVVVVHGGAFQIGYGNMLSPRYLVKTHNVIVVTFNYRLGVHGFLCLGTANAPGNAGLRDQLAALKWVQKNIASFGGDPDNVTISGASAGSMLVDLMHLLPAFDGLFNKVIPESGSSLSGSTVMLDPMATAKEFALDLNFPNSNNVYDLEEFYTTASYELLLSKSFMNQTDQNFGFTPCLDRDVGHGIMVPETPYNILKNGNYKKLPLLFGYANMEGILFMASFENFSKRMNKRFADFLPCDLHFENEDEKETVAQRVKEFYFKDKPVDDDTMYEYIDFYSDVAFAYPTARAVKLQLLNGNGNIYLYEYSFSDVGGTPFYYKNYSTMVGATHCAQTFAVFDGKYLNDYEEDELSPGFKETKKYIRQLWSNFILTGKPVPEGSPLPAWRAMGVDWSPHMSVDRKLELRGSLNLERMRFWDSIYDRYYRSPIPPPPAPTPNRDDL